MRPLHKGFLYTACCALALSLPGRVLAQGGEQSFPRDSQTTAPKPDPPTSSSVIASSSSAASPAEQLAASELPESPGAAWSKAQDASPQQSSSSPSAAPASGQTGTRQTAAAQGQDQGQELQRPVGTAAAEAPKTEGVTAAQLSGVAIAPAKQRRVRTIVLKVGAMVAAGAAVGAVIALAEATPSRPPGAH